MPSAAPRQWFFVLALSLSWLIPALPGQTQEPELPQTTIEALEEWAKRIAAAEEERAQVPEGDTERLAAIDEQLRELRWQLGSMASNFDVEQYERPAEGTFDIKAELEELIRPVIQWGKNLTAESRELSGLQTRREQLEAERMQIQTALRETLATLEQLPPDSPARAAVQWEADLRWRPGLEDLNSQLVIVQGQIDAKARNQKPWLDAASEGARSFLDTSGLSLVLAAFVFCAVFFSLRWIQGRLLKRRVAGRATSLRVLEVTLAALSLLLAIIAALIVPYVRNDWLLLPICIVVLLGVGWVLLKMLPQFFEQIRLVLNIGPVREGERLILEGIPYRVEMLRFYSRLSNPDLQGGELRIPIQDLFSKRSRQCDPDEPWFPCRKGDYVTLDDGVYGQIRIQTPEVVVVEDYAAPRTYPTRAFLAQNPRNLSQGFAVRTTFGVDYRHQENATKTIPEHLTVAVREELQALVPAEQILRVHVEFQQAGSSSLDLDAQVDLDGAAAPLWREIRRALQRALVDACTLNAWTIPFPQLTVHGVPRPAGS